MGRKILFILIILFIFPVFALADLTAIINPYTGKMDFMQNISGVAPANSSTPCVPTSLAYDANYIYVCVGVNSWGRAQLSSWAIVDLLLMSDGTSHILLSDGTSKILIRP